MTKFVTLAAASICFLAGSAALAAEPGAYSARTTVKQQPSVNRSVLIRQDASSEDIDARLANIKASLGALSNRGATRQSQIASLKQAIAETEALDTILLGLAEEDPVAKDARDSVDGLRSALEDAMKDLEAEDRMGNFEIQRLMSQYNQSEQLASSVQKKMDDSKNDVISKIG